MLIENLSGDVGDLGSSLLLSVVEAATQLRIGRTQTYELVMGGQIPSVMIGRRRLIVRSGLEDFVRSLVAKQDVDRL